MWLPSLSQRIRWVVRGMTEEKIEGNPILRWVSACSSVSFCQMQLIHVPFKSPCKVWCWAVQEAPTLIPISFEGRRCIPLLFQSLICHWGEPGSSRLYVFGTSSGSTLVQRAYQVVDSVIRSYPGFEPMEATEGEGLLLCLSKLLTRHTVCTSLLPGRTA